MSTDTIIFVAQTLVLPATLVASLLVTIVVAVTSHRKERRLMSLELLRSVEEQWQTLNTAILTRPEIQQHINSIDNPLSERDVVRRNVAFYVLSLTLQLNRGQQAGLVDSVTAERLHSSHAEFLRQLKAETTLIVGSSDIYRAELGRLLPEIFDIPIPPKVHSFG